MKELSTTELHHMAHKYLKPQIFYGSDEDEHSFLYYECPICKKTYMLCKNRDRTQVAEDNIPHEEDCYWS